ncbi:MAG: hypothetical protein JWQ77_1503 [Jatrophihabitans sp.]|nr:hypothetical protein [Jatrophihabitans sp.]
MRRAISRRQLLVGLGGAAVAAGAVGVDRLVGSSHRRGAALVTAPSGAGAGSGRPSYLPRDAAHAFDAQRGVYNWTAANTVRHAAGLSRVRAGGAAAEVFIGDSLTAGDVGGATFDRLRAWPRIYAATLAADRVAEGGTGLIRVADNRFSDARWHLGAGWHNDTTCAYAATTGARATLSSSTRGTAVAVIYRQAPRGGSFSVSVDGATDGPGFAVVRSRGAARLRRLELTGLADAAHTVEIRTLAASAVVLIAAEIRSERGLICHNVGESGSSASGAGLLSWSDTTTAGGAIQPLTLFAPQSGAYGPGVSTVHCALGTNDLVRGASPDEVTQAIQVIHGACPDVDFILYLQPQPGLVAPVRWARLCTAMYTLADMLDVPLFDLQYLLGGYAHERAEGWVGDQKAHLDPAGYARWGAAVARVAVSSRA